MLSMTAPGHPGAVFVSILALSEKWDALFGLKSALKQQIRAPI
jgi:hypothetical protein